MDKVTAVVLAAGSGRRMGAAQPKQYMLLRDKPILVYSLEVFERSTVDDIILVTGAGEEDFCRKEFVEKYQIHKVRRIVAGGKERYDSVYAGLLAAEGSDYVLIHDCARAFLTEDLVETSIEQVKKYKACVLAVPSKDTVKLSDADGYVASTPNRATVWSIQTPQSFSYPLILQAYEKLQQEDKTGVTDDAMVVEQMTDHRVKLVLGSYNNIKVTTPEDLILGEQILAQ